VGEVTAPISPFAITGFNVGIAMAVVLNLEEFDAIDLRSLRYPPGTDADDWPLTTDMMDAIRVNWQLLGEPDLHLVANFFEGPEHAVAVARYLGELDMLPRWWAVGNEPDLYPQNRMDPSWTAEVYCERFRASRAALEAELGEVTMTGPAVSNVHPAALEYLREVITRCGDVIDVLTLHAYPTDRTASDEAALATSRDLRFGVAWPRVIPTGTGTINAAGFDFYERLVDGLLERGIAPHATLYHWDLPRPLQDAGGWPERASADAFVAYADAVTRRLGNRVACYATLNEPWRAAFLGYASGHHAPGLRDPKLAPQAAHHLLLAHGAALQPMRANAPAARHGIVLDFNAITPATDAPADAAAARRFDGLRNRWFLEPVLLGRYPDAYFEQHIAAVHAAIEAGADVRGYFAWSLMDNFEWGFGFTKRFGLVYVDFATRERVLKYGARWCAELIREQRSAAVLEPA
jgi:hypothetical protein